MTVQPGGAFIFSTIHPPTTTHHESNTMSTETNTEATETTEAASAPETQTQETQESQPEARKPPEGYEIKNEARVVTTGDDEELQKFMEAARTMAELSKKNNWPLIMAGFAPLKVNERSGIASAFAANHSDEAMASTFCMMGMREGFLASAGFMEMSNSSDLMSRVLESYNKKPNAPEN